MLLFFTELLLIVLVCSNLQSQSTASEVGNAVDEQEEEDEVATGVSCQLPFPAEGSKTC